MDAGILTVNLRSNDHRADTAVGGTPRVMCGNIGADDGNRTRMTSLEGWGSAIELHPRDARFGAP